MNMDRQDITKYVIQELGKHHSISDIIITVCEKTGVKWDEAQQFISQVQVEHKDEIIRRQKPIIILMAVMSIVMGLIFSGIMMVVTLNGVIIIIRRIPIPYLGNFLLFVGSLLMAAGGVVGLLNISKN